MRTGIDCWRPVEADDPPHPDMGSAWSNVEGGVVAVKHPIGFQVRREKPRVRIKAWTRPVLKEGNP